MLDWAFRPSMRTFGVKIAAAEMGLCAYFLPHRRGVKFLSGVFYHRVVARWLTRGASSCQCSRVASVSFLVRVLALRVSC